MAGGLNSYTGGCGGGYSSVVYLLGGVGRLVGSEPGEVCVVCKLGGGKGWGGWGLGG